jgi:UDP:flavonoid glycosyltransferase YjiC (YdhE family)
MSLARELEAAVTEDPSESAALQRLAELTAECEVPSAPTIPNATNTTMDAMVEAQEAVQTFIEASTEALECLEELAEDDDLSDEDRALADLAYNNEVTRQETLATQWNTQREMFLALQE